MSYLALARKWRPTQFRAVVGQSHVLTALEHALSQNRLHHAYLFSGTRGVGKTTIGRLFAKGMNCETGITSTPCGQCAACQEIDQGRFVDLLEIDAASRTKVEDTRELLDNVQYKPARGRFKIYLIDEVHMLSRHSFNALLKTLEEPPEYVKFLLATTDPQKLPVTILSRCLQFHLKPIQADQIEAQLVHILHEEDVVAQPRALGLIAHASDGSMRDALSLTDQAIALGHGQVNYDNVSHMLGTIETDHSLHLLQALSHKAPQQVMTCVERLNQQGVAWDVLLQSLSEQLHRIAMYQMLPESADPAAPDLYVIQQLSHELAAEDVQLFYQIAIKGREDLPLAPTPRIGLEMILLRMLAFRPVETSPVHQILTTQPTSTMQPSPVQSSMPVSAEGQPTDAVLPPGAPLVSETPMSESMAAPQVPEHVMPASSVAPQSVSAAPEPAVTGVVRLRHQLRSQRMKQQEHGASLSQSETENRGKKSDGASSQPLSAFERLRQQQGQAQLQGQEISVMSAPDVTPRPQHVKQGQSAPFPSSGGEGMTSAETISQAEMAPYQWRPSEPLVAQAPNTELTPKAMKRTLEHDKTPAMHDKLVKEVQKRDAWAAMVARMQVSKLAEQLALNAAFSQQGQAVTLTLRSHQAHLKEREEAAVCAAVQQQLGADCTVVIEIGDAGITPMELREQCYQEYLQKATQQLRQDPNVQWLEQRFQARLDDDSIRPI